MESVFVTCRCIRKPITTSRPADHVERGHDAASTYIIASDQSGGSTHNEYGRSRCHADQRQHPEHLTDSAAASCASVAGCSHQVNNTKK